MKCYKLIYKLFYEYARYYVMWVHNSYSSIFYEFYIWDAVDDGSVRGET
jgi:hypothetical protein